MVPASFSLRAPESGRGLPQSKTLRDQPAAVPCSNRSWTAPALGRFGGGHLGGNARREGQPRRRPFPLITAVFPAYSRVFPPRAKKVIWQSWNILYEASQW